MHLKKCSGCARAIVESATKCDYCGHQAADPVESAPGVDNQGDDEDVFALEDLFEEGPPSLEGLREEEPAVEGVFDEQPLLNVAPGTTTPQEPLSVPEVHEPVRPARRRMGKRQLVTGMIGVVGGGLLILMMMPARGAASKAEAVPPQPAPKRQTAARTASPAKPGPAATKAEASGAATAGAAPSAAVSPPRADVPTWVGNAEAWAPNDRRAAAFEVASTSRVQVWMRTVQPMLVVRCRAGRLEAFVFTDTAAKMEPQDQDHTVRLRFDGGAETSARWPDSAEHDSLFARDGAAFVQQLLTAETLQFGFTPHNADPAVAVFHVSGLQEHLASARACGSKPALRSAAPRSAR